MKTNRRTFLLGSTGLCSLAISTSAKPQTSNMSNSPESVGNRSGMSIASLKDTSPSVGLSRLLRCIAEVETGNDDFKIGLNGERSRYQITPAVWNQRNGFLTPSKLSVEHFEMYCRGSEATTWASIHLRWLDAHLPPCTRPFWLAFAWHAGLERTKLELRGASVSPGLYAYARKVTNLYEDVKFST